jgi:hypothetical protein
MNVNTSDPLGLQAKVAGLERRVRYLEERAFGEPRPENCFLTLYSIYVDALMGRIDLTQTSADLWNHVVINLDEEVLLALGRHTSDPFPWRPLLLVLDHFTDNGFDTEVASSHLLNLAKSFLHLQGLSRLKPEDMLAGVVDPHSVLSAS